MICFWQILIITYFFFLDIIFRRCLLVAQLPEALVIGCPETEEGAIAKLPDSITLQSYQAIACGPGLTRSTLSIIEQLLDSPVPLVLDADGLNNLVTLGISHLHQRKSPTILTPHAGEFKRLFPQIKIMPDRIHAARQAASESGTVVILKGAKTAIADPDGTVWVNPESTPALARGGSGDVLAGLLGGILAQGSATVTAAASAATAAVWWHGQAGILAAEDRSVLGVDAFHLTQYLTRSVNIPLRSIRNDLTSVLDKNEEKVRYEVRNRVSLTNETSSVKSSKKPGF
ncbi:NAD(P)H-hydrate dehydratase [Roseofilum casamattae]|uniref:NAD(P)H-hydrate dehydratase n=1 Tax=Roseofilum casamattae BLCC-M143 TaxID=3022442 RepID=A0ABT7C3L2_9CYAN|nr:NAD(P)H-hydrate dehydratase [Roseofilum casamattae]MDJ1185183.1 NAD(P)H-hydrate dehydratase [Roseofilum casamattae BLCC-M143]